MELPTDDLNDILHDEEDDNSINILKDHCAKFSSDDDDEESRFMHENHFCVWKKRERKNNLCFRARLRFFAYKDSI